MTAERRGDGVWLLLFLVMVAFAKFPDADAGERHGRPPARGHQHGGERAAAPPPAPGSCAALPPSRIAAYARRAGFSADQAVTATAVALAESGGRPCAHNAVAPDDSYCLWQVNMLGRLGPERRARFHLSSNRQLYDPATCARVAYAISSGGSDWTPWTTFTRGTYRAFLARARAAQGRG